MPFRDVPPLRRALVEGACQCSDDQGEFLVASGTCRVMPLTKLTTQVSGDVLADED